MYTGAMLSETTMAQTALDALKYLTFQVREPSYNQPDFWSSALTITRARPLPANLPWTDFVEIPLQSSYARIIRSFVATSFAAGAVEYRWVYTNGLLAPDSVTLPSNVERHLNRLAPHPYPCSFRDFVVRSSARGRLRLQVRNLTANQQLAFAAVYGWYYPDLASPNEIASQEGIDGTIRDF